MKEKLPHQNSMESPQPGFTKINSPEWKKMPMVPSSGSNLVVLPRGPDGCEYAYRRSGLRTQWVVRKRDGVWANLPSYLNMRLIALNMRVPTISSKQLVGKWRALGRPVISIQKL